VDITVKNGSRSDDPRRAHEDRSSPAALLKLLGTVSQCSEADVNALLQAIEADKKPVRFNGVFDKS
jgi:hypothetical protein